MSPWDLIVVGAGPAGLALAAAAGDTGQRVLVLDPSPDAPWRATFGDWQDQVEGLPTEHRWGAAEVRGQDWCRVVERAYVRLDGPALRQQLLDRCAAAGVSVEAARVAAATHGATGSVVTLQGGQQRSCRIVADCSGHRPVLVDCPGPAASIFQVALGALIRVEGHDWPLQRMVLMDLRRTHRTHDALPPTFLYVMPFSPDLVFVEETVLAAAMPPRPELLRPLLEARLVGHGVQVIETVHEEHCVIPMDSPLPRLDQRVVAIGGAAAGVHPATGYSIARSLGTAPAVARTLAEHSDPTDAASAAWAQIWPQPRLALWEVLAFGRQTMCRLDAATADAFFRSFFSVPQDRWAPFLAGTATARQAGSLMLTMTQHASPGLRLQLAAAGMTAQGLSALRAMAMQSASR